MVRSAPALFMFALVQVFVHLGLLLFVGQRWPRRTLLLASNANVGGPTTAAGMAAAKGWRSSIVPSILIGTHLVSFLVLSLKVTQRADLRHMLPQEGAGSYVHQPHARCVTW